MGRKRLGAVRRRCVDEMQGLVDFHAVGDLHAGAVVEKGHIQGREAMFDLLVRLGGSRLSQGPRHGAVRQLVDIGERRRKVSIDKDQRAAAQAGKAQGFDEAFIHRPWRGFGQSESPSSDGRDIGVFPGFLLARREAMVFQERQSLVAPLRQPVVGQPPPEAVELSQVMVDSDFAHAALASCPIQL